jgi:hypothetical protein
MLEVFIGSAIQAPQPFQVALAPISLTLILLNYRGETIASLPLPGKTMAAGLDWLKQEISKLRAEVSEIVFLDYPPDDFPDHALAHGAAFSDCNQAALSELANYYANTYHLLQDIIAAIEDATNPRIWPHHFDLATLVMLPEIQNGTPLTVGGGFSPGDTSYNEPYWYVSPYRYPSTTRLPVLAGDGFWRTQHWVGAVLPASRLVEGSADQQQVGAFLNSALSASIALLKPESLTEV